MATCTAPAAIANGVIITSGTYADGDHAVFRCDSGYIMSGTSYITCSMPADTWTASPSCVASSSNTVTVNDSTSYSELVIVRGCELVDTCFIWQFSYHTLYQPKTPISSRDSYISPQTDMRIKG